MSTNLTHVALYGWLLGTFNEVKKFPELDSYHTRNSWGFDSDDVEKDIQNNAKLDMSWDGCNGEYVFLGKKLTYIEEYEAFDTTELKEQDLSSVANTPFADRLKDTAPKFYVFTEVH